MANLVLSVVIFGLFTLPPAIAIALYLGPRVATVLQRLKGAQMGGEL